MVCEGNFVDEPACLRNGASPWSEEVLAVWCRGSRDSSDWEQGWVGSVQ